MDWTAVDRLLVEGETVSRADGRQERCFPSFQKIADRFGVSKTMVHRFARAHDCLARRNGNLPRGLADLTAAPCRSERPGRGNGRHLEAVRAIFERWVRDVCSGTKRIANAAEVKEMMLIAVDLDADECFRALLAREAQDHGN